jgi:hypothetical protein
MARDCFALRPFPRNGRLTFAQLLALVQTDPQESYRAVAANGGAQVELVHGILAMLVTPFTMAPKKLAALIRSRLPN